MKSSDRNHRGRRPGVMAGVMAAAAVVIALVLNAIVAEGSDRLGLTWDLTQEHRYGLSEDTTAYLDTLEKDVEIHVLAEESALATGGVYTAQLYQTLEAYAASPRVRLDYVNLLLHPTFLSRYPEQSLSANDVIVQCGQRLQVLHLADMLKTSTKVDDTTYTASTSIESSAAEQVLTNAVMFVTADDLVGVSILMGFSEADPADLEELLEGNSFQVRRQSLMTEEIDPNADVAILYGLRRDMEEHLLKKLDTWLSNGGLQGKTLFLLADSRQVGLPNVNRFLREWGMELGTGVALEQDAGRYYYYPYYPAAQYAQPEYAGELLSSENPVIMALSCPLSSLETGGNYTVEPLLSLSETALLMKTEGGSEPVGEAGIDVMLLSTHKNYGAETNVSRVVLSGSYQAFSSNLLTSSTFSNAEYLLGLLNRFTQRQHVVSIAPKDFSTASHSMNSFQVYTLSGLFAAALPLCLLAAGGMVWLRRRNG